eukprot:snap_masked-scaffold_3-processed-gene-21.17-mRNA-1 protein AED:1.00 eAED:1.00 QI:0/-1/0/0/-1/1/1/0/316
MRKRVNKKDVDAFIARLFEKENIKPKGNVSISRLSLNVKVKEEERKRRIKERSQTEHLRRQKEEQKKTLEKIGKCRRIRYCNTSKRKAVQKKSAVSARVLTKNRLLERRLMLREETLSKEINLKWNRIEKTKQKKLCKLQIKKLKQIRTRQAITVRKFVETKVLMNYGLLPWKNFLMDAKAIREKAKLKGKKKIKRLYFNNVKKFHKTESQKRVKSHFFERLREVLVWLKRQKQKATKVSQNSNLRYLQECLQNVQITILRKRVRLKNVFLQIYLKVVFQNFLLELQKAQEVRLKAEEIQNWRKKVNEWLEEMENN